MFYAVVSDERLRRADQVQVLLSIGALFAVQIFEDTNLQIRTCGCETVAVGAYCNAATWKQVER